MMDYKTIDEISLRLSWNINVIISEGKKDWLSGGSVLNVYDIRDIFKHLDTARDELRKAHSESVDETIHHSNKVGANYLKLIFGENLDTGDKDD